MTLAAILPVFWRAPPQAVGFWLLAVAAIIVGMVTLGGLTRITGSGLSITRMGSDHGRDPAAERCAVARRVRQVPADPAIPPREPRHERWTRSRRSSGGNGRIGCSAACSASCSSCRSSGSRGRARSRAREWPRMVVLFALGGLQGFVGWWMVRERTGDARLRLAIPPRDPSRRRAHPARRDPVDGAGVSPLTLSALGREGRVRGRRSGRSTPPHPGPLPRFGGEGVRLCVRLVALVYVQMLLGALVAGLHAGLIYNTWPSMDGRVFPEIRSSSRLVDQFLREPRPRAVRSPHRRLYRRSSSRIALLAGATRAQADGTHAVDAADSSLHSTVFQVVLGIVTLLTQAPASARRAAPAHRRAAVLRRASGSAFETALQRASA